MKSLITADLHIGTFSNLKLGHDKGRDRRLSDIEEVLNRIVEIATEYEACGAYILGDVFNRKGPISPQSFQLWCSFVHDLASLQDFNYGVRVTPGNHDYGRDKATFLDPKDSLSVIEDIGNYMPNIGVIMIPWVSDPIAFIKERLAFANKQHFDDIELVMGHFALSGAEMQKGIYDQCSVDHKELKKIFPNAKIVAGHYHIPQEVAKGVYYVGSPLQINWGESGKECRVLIYDHDSKELESVPIESPEFGKVTIRSEADLGLLKDLGNVEYLRIYYDDGIKLPTEEIDKDFRVVQYIPQSFGHCEGRSSVDLITPDEAIDQYTEDENLRIFGKKVLSEVL